MLINENVRETDTQIENIARLCRPTSMKLITLTGSVEPSTAPSVKPCDSVQPIRFPPPRLCAKGITVCWIKMPKISVLQTTTTKAKVRIIRRSRFK